MKILAIDTTSPAGSVAVLENGKLMCAIPSAEAEPYSSRLHRDVDRLLAETNSTLPQVDVFAVAAGPGSFTGVRVGLAAVKAWAEVYQKPVAAVSALEAIAAQASARDRLVAAISDAHRGQWFAGLYERSGEVLLPRGQDVVLPPEECLAYFAGQSTAAEFVIRTTIPESVRAAIAGHPGNALRVESADPVLAPAIALLGYSRAQRGELADALTLDAHYVRRSDAELLWKGR